MNPSSEGLKTKKTYIVAVLIILYGVIFRGFGANDWNTATIMISTALIGICLRYELIKPAV
ncbi:MAG: hypothetical protein WC750_05220 [Patescibacteria group bacterium]|jgi:hypothetical protein